MWKSNVVAAIDLLGREHGNPDILCRTAPRAAVAITQFKAGECVIVPITNRISIKPALDALQYNLVCGGAAPMGEKLVLVQPASMLFPAWFIQTSSVKKDCNMKIVMKSVEVGAKFVCKGAKLEATPIDVPVYVNKKMLCQGDELIVYRAAVERVAPKRTFDQIE